MLISQKIIEVQDAGKMTENQQQAYVRLFFKKIIRFSDLSTAFPFKA